MLATDDGVGCHQRSPSLMPAYPFQHQSSPQKFTSHHDGMPSALLASPETPISCSFPAHQMPQSLPTPNPSPERPGPFHSHNLPVHFPHYPHFAPPTPQPEDQKVPVKRKPGRPPKSAAQKAADAAARKAISSPKKSIADKQNPKVPSKTGNPRGRPRKQVAQPPSQAKSDISLGEPASVSTIPLCNLV